MPGKPLSYLVHGIESENSSDGELDNPRIHHRRNSIGEDLGKTQNFLIDIHRVKRHILRHEDTDGDERVTIEDRGPKHLHLPLEESFGFIRKSIMGNYMVSTLLQELALLEDDTTMHGPQAHPPPRPHVIISKEQLTENPVDRLTRMINKYFWPALVRRVDAEGLTLICMDPKDRGTNKQPRVYVPHDDQKAWEYFQEVAHSRIYLNLDVVQLPKDITPDYVKSLNERPGILSLALSRSPTVGEPFIVPGGRFNELYGWDSYFIILGLLQSDDREKNLQIAKGIVNNLVYEIEHYGMILNANRSYYLRRSQPPFLTDMVLSIYRQMESKTEEDTQWLEKAMVAAIKEYQGVWMSEPRLIKEIGLSRYCSDVEGIPPETESTHFNSLLTPYTEKYGMTMSEFIIAFNNKEIIEPELEEYFLHDRAVRESGHDTTYRLDGRAANLLTVDLCALLYKYETDIARFIDDHHAGALTMPDGSQMYSKDFWKAAENRRRNADQFLWDEARNMYFDYDYKRQERSTYESVTCLWPLWAGMCSKEQAEGLVKHALPKFEEAGGLVSGTRASRGGITLNKPTRQWDYPYGWAPHQMLAWQGLTRYGYERDTHRLVYRWLYMITRAFSDFNGVVPEKFDVVRMSHKVEAEYGNVGTDFCLVPREGFGWMNASYLAGLAYLNRLERRGMGALVHPDSLFASNGS